MPSPARIEAEPFLAFALVDVDQAHAEWGCNCGPAALAACLGWTLTAVRPTLVNFEGRGYLNPWSMSASINSAGFRHADADRMLLWPRHGLVRVQFGGPWTAPGASPRWAATHTHWIATKAHEGAWWVYDVNAGWLTAPAWTEEIIPRLTAAIPRADGRWETTHRWEVRRR